RCTATLLPKALLSAAMAVWLKATTIAHAWTAKNCESLFILPFRTHQEQPVSGTASNRKQSLNLFGIGAVDGDLFTFVIARADNNFHLAIPVQVEGAYNCVRVRRVEGCVGV